MNQIRLFLVDDEHAVRQGLRMRLGMEPDFVVVGEAADGRRAVTEVASIRPDVVLMDIHMPVIDGIQATAELRDTVPGCAVVMLSMQDDADTRARARQAGAVGFVSKHQIESALAAAIRTAAHGAGASGGGGD
jgi:DNA-binding NarL/FixJ family response regulator